MRRAFGLGWWTLCIASLLVIPVTYAWVVALEALQVSTDTQDIVRQVVESPTEDVPWMIAIFGVLIAPFVEESMFRGMLYPLGRRMMGGTRSAAISSAVVTSALFAIIHQSGSALVPLLPVMSCFCRSQWRQRQDYH